MDSKRIKSKDLAVSIKQNGHRRTKDKRQCDKNTHIEKRGGGRSSVEYGKKLSAITINTSGINKFISVYFSRTFCFSSSVQQIELHVGVCCPFLSETDYISTVKLMSSLTSHTNSDTNEHGASLIYIFICIAFKGFSCRANVLISMHR